MKATLEAYRRRFLRASDRMDAAMHDSRGRNLIKVLGDARLRTLMAREVRLLRLNTLDQGGTPVVRLGRWWTEYAD